MRRITVECLILQLATKHAPNIFQQRSVELLQPAAIVVLAVGHGEQQSAPRRKQPVKPAQNVAVVKWTGLVEPLIFGVDQCIVHADMFQCRNAHDLIEYPIRQNRVAQVAVDVRHVRFAVRLFRGKGVDDNRFFRPGLHV